MSEFNVRPFAFMRLTHEALRAGLSTLLRHAGAGDLEAVRGEYATLRRVIEIHAAQEEKSFFPLLAGRFPEDFDLSVMLAAHEREEALQEAFEGALDADDLAAVQKVLADWADSFEQHLVDEETVMMPLTQRVAPDLEGRAAAVRDILHVDWEALKGEHLPYVVASLAANKPYGPVRMFVAALQHAAGDRFSELAPVVLSSVSDDVGAKLRAHGHATALVA